MEQSPWKRIRRIYRGIMAVATIVVGALMIWQVIAIYQAGNAPENLSAGVYIQPVYSREIVAEHFMRIAPVVYLWLCGVAAGLIGWLIQPEEAPGVKGAAEAEETLRKLRLRLPDAAQADKDVMNAIRREEKLRRWAWIAAAAVCTICAVMSGAYLLKVEHFTSWELESVMGSMMLAVTPWVVLAFAAVCAAVEVRRISAEREVPLVKKIMVKGKRPQLKQETRGGRVNVLRAVLYAAAIALVVLGVLNGGMRDVLIKAINICTECIGLG